MTYRALLGIGLAAIVVNQAAPPQSNRSTQTAAATGAGPVVGRSPNGWLAAAMPSCVFSPGR
jgi:hypothetical protein